MAIDSQLRACDLVNFASPGISGEAGQTVERNSAKMRVMARDFESSLVRTLRSPPDMGG